MKFVRVSCNDLHTIRITCKACGNAFEIDVGSLQRQKDEPWKACPMCDDSLLLALGDEGKYENVLAALARALLGVKALSNQKQARIEFVIPDQD